MFFSRKTIKYDLERFANLCGVHLHEDQSTVARYLDDHKFSFIDKHRQNGISMMLALDGLKVVCEKTKGKFNKKNVVYVCRNHEQIEYKHQLFLRFYNKLSDKLRPSIEVRNKSEIHFSSGATVRFVVNPESILGIKIDEEIFDEVNEKKMDDFYKHAVGCLSVDGKIIMSHSHGSPAVYTKLPLETNTIHI